MAVLPMIESWVRAARSCEPPAHGFTRQSELVSRHVSSPYIHEASPMNIRPGVDVLKDGRPGTETSLNSAGVGSAIGDSNDQNTLTAGFARVRFDRYVLDHQRGCLFAGDEEITLRPKTFE